MLIGCRPVSRLVRQQEDHGMSTGLCRSDPLLLGPCQHPTCYAEPTAGLKSARTGAVPHLTSPFEIRAALIPRLHSPADDVVLRRWKVQYCVGIFATRASTIQISVALVLQPALAEAEHTEHLNRNRAWYIFVELLA